MKAVTENKDIQNDRVFYRKTYFVFMAAFCIFSLLLYTAGGKEFKERISKKQIEAFESDNVAGDLTEGRIVRQQWKNKVFCIQQAGVLASNYAKEISGNLHMELWNADSGTLLAERTAGNRIE